MKNAMCFEIVIAGITIQFQTSHQSDIDCLEELFLYHKDKNNMPYERGEATHNVIITSLVKPFDLPEAVVPVWEGFVNAGEPVATVWHHAGLSNEVFITVGRDILIHHIPEKKSTTCYFREKKNIVGRFRRPKLNVCIFLLIHSILSIYEKYSVHSACVAKDGLAYIFLGNSGSGKTTISNILSSAGFDYMGDDLVFISRNDNGEIVVDSLLCNAKIINENPGTNKIVKNIVDVIKKYDYSYLYRQKLGAIYLLQRKNTVDSVLKPVRQVDVYDWLLHSGNNIKMQHNPQLWLDICEQASTLLCRKLIFGNKEHFDSEIFNDVMRK